MHILLEVQARTASDAEPEGTTGGAQRVATGTAAAGTGSTHRTGITMPFAQCPGMWQPTSQAGGRRAGPEEAAEPAASVAAVRFGWAGTVQSTSTRSPD